MTRCGYSYPAARLLQKSGRMNGRCGLGESVGVGCDLAFLGERNWSDLIGWEILVLEKVFKSLLLKFCITLLVRSMSD